MKKRLTDLLMDLKNLPFEEEEARLAVQKATEQVLSDEALLSAAQKHYDALFGGEMLGREIILWEDKEADAKLGDSMIFTVVLFARACALEKEKAYLYDGKTVGFYKALMRHFGVNICRNKSYGMQEAQRFWAYCYVKPISFELGRLAFEILDYHYDYTVFKNPLTKEHFPFANGGQTFDKAGLPDSEGSFTTTLEVAGDTVCGYTYTDLGHLDFEKKTVAGVLPVLSAGDKAIAVHMPGNAKLDAESISASIESAKVFFSNYFPQLDYKAFVSSSWLLDTGLRQFLKEDSNIVKLQKRFRIALAFKNDFSLYDNIFNVPKCPIEELVPQNRFQQNVLDMLKAGGSLYSGRGYILKEEL